MIRPTALLRPLHLLLLAAPALAQGAADNLALGKMWTFENPPLAYLEQEYGFKPDQQWLDSLRLGALRLGERENPWCSASFVSPKGLIMTNHHCVREQVGQIQGEHDWVKDGYAATALEDEVKIPGLTVHQLVAQEDITAKVDEGVADGDDAATIAKKREANIAAIKKAADEAHPGFMHQVVALYEGAVQQLYRYRVFDDLRLVMAVNLQTAHFGGDPDNFTYPRWSIDFSFVRAYEDDKPADTSANYFRWRQDGAKEGELVFVPGNPGNTNRLMTVAQLECQRDIEYPLILQQLESGMAILRPYSDRSPGLLTTLLGWENSYKAISGMWHGLQDEELLGKKRAHEANFKAAVQGNPELAAKYGKVWDELEALATRKRAVQPKVAFYAPSYSPVVERGVAIAKALDASLDEEARGKAREEALGMQMFGNVLTQALLVDHFVRASKWLGMEDPYVKAVAGDQGKGGEVDWKKALRATMRSRLGDNDWVKGLLDAEDGAAQFAASDDPGVIVARTLWPLMRDTEKEQKAIEDAIAVQGTKIGQALFAVFGNKVSPDATMTLRFSDGRVAGYAYNGTLAPWATTFYGLYGRTIEFGGKHPFDLAEPWVQAKDQIDMKKHVCFASTNDIVGGNSGSCMVDKDLQVVGLIFDGNIESLPNDFYYTQKVARAVSVHTDAIVEALSKVYGMGRIVTELREGAAKK
ncbi:MAG: S46 family peptidase [Planctomycetes bacterium]|nr:S46 family peptidase [Planctomycetota bacterium]